MFSRCIFSKYSALSVIIFLLFVGDVHASASYAGGGYLSPNHVREMKNETRQLFLHAWGSYMDYGFPADEVTPITCEPYGPDYENVDNLVRNDAMGNVSLMVLDNIDTLIILERWQELEFVLGYLRLTPDLFEKDTTIQVFETTIRSLGGLLLSHLLLELLRDDVKSKFTDIPCIQSYDGFLLEMALDLGYRLIPAFKTKTQIPVPRINLSRGVKGVPLRLQMETCTAGAASPILEFTLLSKLTGDLVFQNYTEQTFWKLWNSRLALNLLPMTIDPITSQWKDSITGIGASVDSFYEYAAKGSILFEDVNFWEVFQMSYRALLAHLRYYEPSGSSSGWMIFSNVEINRGYTTSAWIDLLGAFWPGLQVLTGQVSDAIKSHLVYMKLWNTFDLIPERWDFMTKPPKGKPSLKNKTSYDYNIVLEWYPLRPEFIESTYYLYRSTRDPMYLQIGARILDDFQYKYKTECGFGGFQNIKTGERQDRMETFVLSESLKYLFLLFDEADEVFLHSPLMRGKNWIFSTEAHPMWYDKRKYGNNNSSEKMLIARLNRNVTEKDDGPNIELSLLEKLKSKYFNSHGKLLDVDKKTGIPEVRRYTMPDHAYIDIVDPFKERYYQCEVNPFPMGPFMSLAYYKMDELFISNSVYGLQRPEHLGESRDFELNGSFYNQFSLTLKSNWESGIVGGLQSPRVQTTEVLDMYIGDTMHMNEIEVTKFQQVTTLGELRFDLWVPEFNAMRIRVEKLQAGLIDSMNNEITQAYIEEIQLDRKRDKVYSVQDGITVLENDLKIDNESVLRIIQINGVDVDPRGVVWTLPYTGQILKYNTNNLMVVLEGMMLENVLAWW